NVEFWESATGLGGASDQTSERFSRDYKDADVFSNKEAKELLIVCHNEGKALGWRTWKLLETKTLHGWFTTGNTCSSGLDTSKRYKMADETTGGDVGHLIEWEPLIKNTHNGVDDLYVNTEMNTNDFNRLSTNRNGGYNLGSGLGTQYDANLASNCGDTERPQADAQMRTEKYHWGSGGGIGGLIGSDHNCHGGCPWTISSGSLDF
ncbi:unnamed protein product, partial [Symbiodinium pilosum]